MTIYVYRRPTRVRVANSGADPNPDPPPVTGGVTIGVTRFGSPAHQLFPSTAWINRARPTDGSLLIDSANDAIVAQIVSDAGLGARPTLNTTRFSLPAYTVDPTVPLVPVKQHDQPIPNYKLAMSQFMLDPGLPVPSTHVNQGDSDDEWLALMVDGSGNPVRAAEAWRLRPLATPEDVSITWIDGTTRTFTGVAWEATSVWNITGISTHPARSRNHNLGSYPNAIADATKRLDYEDTNMSVAAARIPFIGTQLTREDVELGLDSSGLLTGATPSHLLNLSVVHPGLNHRWPAATDDGFVSGSPVEEGMRAYFDETVYTVSAINAMNVHPLCRLCIWFIVVCGIAIVDKSGALEIDGEPSVHDFFNGTAPSAILNGFPWGDLKIMAKTNADGSALTDASPFPH